MNTVDLIRAWKDAEYRNELSDAQRAALPEHPAGMVELPDEEMVSVAGGGRTVWTGTCNRVCEVLTPQYNCFVTS